MNIQAPRGTKDILPPESYLWQEIEQAVHAVARSFGYEEIRTPAFEQLRLFKRSVGEETDIVSKEMYVFQDRGGEDFALRPELTASTVRAALEHNLITQQGALARLYYNGQPNFRYEKPQLGRQRQFHQFGTELLGSASPLADADTIAFAVAVYKKLGLSNFVVKLNSLASREARAIWRDELVKYLSQHEAKLSEESKRRLLTNPIRVLDSKDRGDREVVKNAPLLIESLSGEDKEHFDELKSLLTSIGLTYEIDPLLVRGLDYYSRTVFELTSSDLGSQDALCGGGRYDYLVEQLGGPAVPAVGFAAGVERLAIILQKMRGEQAQAPPIDAYLVGLNAEARPRLFELAAELRAAGHSVVYDIQDRSMKAQMREANRLKAKQVLILGESELAAGTIAIKDMAIGEQRFVALADIATELERSARPAGA